MGDYYELMGFIGEVLYRKSHIDRKTPPYIMLVSREMMNDMSSAYNEMTLISVKEKVESMITGDGKIMFEDILTHDESIPTIILYKKCK